MNGFGRIMVHLIPNKLYIDGGYKAQGWAGGRNMEIVTVIMGQHL